ncbi:MAG: O-antigen ligase family protein [Bacteroidota bacterium]
MQLPLKQKLFYFFPVLFCFSLPFGSRLLSVIVACWTIVSFFNIQKADIKQGFKNTSLWLLFLFFIITVISALFSENREEGLFGIEVKLSVLLFPWLLFCFAWPTEILKRCVVAFVSGCFFACVYLITRAFYYSFNGQPEYFFYSLFSDLIHASYFAMYLILAIVIVILFYRKWFSTQRTIMYSAYFFVAVFVITIFLCSSKLGIISFFIAMPILALYRLKDRLNTKTVIVVLSSVLVLLVVAYVVFPGSFSRLRSIASVSASPDKTSAESTAVRILIWDQAIDLIGQNPLFGTGVGDVNDDLYNAYRQQGITGALEHKLNAHNQYLQTFIGMGLVGFILLCFLTVGQLIKAIWKKNFLLFMFALLVSLNFLVESMLQTAAGILFFTFFVCVFNLTNEKKLLGE